MERGRRPRRGARGHPGAPGHPRARARGDRLAGCVGGGHRHRVLAQPPGSRRAQPERRQRAHRGAVRVRPARIRPRHRRDGASSSRARQAAETASIRSRRWPGPTTADISHTSWHRLCGACFEDFPQEVLDAGGPWLYDASTDTAAPAGTLPRALLRVAGHLARRLAGGLHRAFGIRARAPCPGRGRNRFRGSSRASRAAWLAGTTAILAGRHADHHPARR